MDESNRYGVLAVTVIAVFVASIVAVLTRGSWADSDTTLAATAPTPTTTTSLPTFPTVPVPPTTLPAPVAATIPPPVPTVPRPVVAPAPPKPAPAPRPVPAPSATPSPTPVPAPPAPPPARNAEQRAENDVSFNYGPNPSDRTAGSSRPSGQTGPLGFVIGVVQSGDNWEITADVSDNSSAQVRFDGGLDVLVHLDCTRSTDDHTRTAEDFRLHNPSVTSLGPREGLKLRLGPLRPSDPGPGTCSAVGTVKYSSG